MTERFLGSTDDELGAALRELSGALRWPAEPDIAAAVTVSIRDRRDRIPPFLPRLSMPSRRTLRPAPSPSRPPRPGRPPSRHQPLPVANRPTKAPYFGNLIWTGPCGAWRRDSTASTADRSPPPSLRPQRGAADYFRLAI